MGLNIFVENRRTSAATLEKKHGKEAIVLDLTSKGERPWVRFSPFYPHGNIPVPFSPGVYGESVEGIWQALKVFETCDVDLAKLSITNMKGIKRTVRTLGRVLGHRAGVNDAELLPYLDARKQIYLPSYKWVLENCLSDELCRLDELAASGMLILLDYETNTDVNNLSKPLSHAGLVKAYLENNWRSVKS